MTVSGVTVKSNGSATPKGVGSKEERPLIAAIEKFHKETHLFIASLTGCLRSMSSEDHYSKIALQYLFHLTRDPDPDIVYSACRAINTVLRESPHNILFNAETTFGALCTCFVEKTLGDLSDVKVQNILVESSSGIIALWAVLDAEALGRCPDHLLTCVDRCLVCLQSQTSEIQLCAMQLLSTLYDPKYGDVEYDQVRVAFEHIRGLINHNTELTPAAFNLFTRAMASLPSTFVDEILHLSYGYIKDNPNEEEITLSTMNFIESSIVQSPISKSIDAGMCDVLCHYVEQGIDEKRSTSILALQILARLVNEDDTFSLYLQSYDKVLAKICECLEDIESSQLLPSLFILGHVCKSSPSACEVIINHDVDVAKSVAVVLVHCEQSQVQQVAAWVLGVLGSSTVSAARKVAESGALLAMIDILSKKPDTNDNVCTACLDSCTATIENLDFLEALAALLKLEALDIRVLVAVYTQLSRLLHEKRILCADFVQSGSLETLIALGEKQPDLQKATKAICDLYPPDLVNRCSPKYMKGLIEKFKRDSIRDAGGVPIVDQSSPESLLGGYRADTIPDTDEQQQEQEQETQHRVPNA